MSASGGGSDPLPPVNFPLDDEYERRFFSNLE